MAQAAARACLMNALQKVKKAHCPFPDKGCSVLIRGETYPKHGNRLSVFWTGPENASLIIVTGKERQQISTARRLREIRRKKSGS